MPRTDVSYDAGLRRRLAGPGNPLTRLAVLHRRVLVGVAAAGHLAAAVLPWPAAGGWLPVAQVGLFGALLVSVALALATRTVADLPERVLDERSRARREWAAFVAIRIAATVVGLSALAAAFAVGRPGFTASFDQAATAAVAVAVLVTALPTWVLAWIEPGPLLDEETVPDRVAPGPLPWSRLLLSGGLFTLSTGTLRLLGWGISCRRRPVTPSPSAS